MDQFVTNESLAYHKLGYNGGFSNPLLINNTTEMVQTLQSLSSRSFTATWTLTIQLVCKKSARIYSVKFLQSRDGRN